MTGTSNWPGILLDYFHYETSTTPEDRSKWGQRRQKRIRAQTLQLAASCSVIYTCAMWVQNGCKTLTIWPGGGLCPFCRGRQQRISSSCPDSWLCPLSTEHRWWCGRCSLKQPQDCLKLAIAPSNDMPAGDCWSWDLHEVIEQYIIYQLRLSLYVINPCCTLFSINKSWSKEGSSYKSGFAGIGP